MYKYYIILNKASTDFDMGECPRTNTHTDNKRQSYFFLVYLI
jgi:hypothetical protein